MSKRMSNLDQDALILEMKNVNDAIGNAIINGDMAKAETLSAKFEKLEKDALSRNSKALRDLVRFYSGSN
jgi:hypothetical protein